MRRIIFAMFTFIFCLSWAEVKVEKVLETTSIKEYNQWVMKNRSKAVGLNPINVQVWEAFEGKTKKITINYYADNGDRIKYETIIDTVDQVWIGKSNSCDRVIIYRCNINKHTNYEVTVKDKQGHVLFVHHIPLDYSEIGDLYFASNLGEDAYADSSSETVILNGSGYEIGKLKAIGGMERSSLQIPQDKRYVVFRGYRSVGGMPLVVVDSTGTEKWRKDLKGIASVFISSDGSVIGANAPLEKIVLFKENGDIYREYFPFRNNHKQICGALSKSGRWLIVGLDSKLRLYDNLSGELKQEDSTLVAKNDTVRYIHILDENTILAICWSNHLYIFNEKSELSGFQNLNLGKTKYEIKEKIIDLEEPGIKKTKVVKTIDIPVRNWEYEIAGSYLIIKRAINEHEKNDQNLLISIFEIKK